MKTLGETIKEKRKAKGLNVAQLARLIGLHPGTLYSYESDTMHPLDKNINRLAEILDCEAAELLALKRASKMQKETPKNIKRITNRQWLEKKTNRGLANAIEDIWLLVCHDHTTGCRKECRDCLAEWLGAEYKGKEGQGNGND